MESFFDSETMTKQSRTNIEQGGLNLAYREGLRTGWHQGYVCGRRVIGAWRWWTVLILTGMAGYANGELTKLFLSWYALQ